MAVDKALGVSIMGDKQTNRLKSSLSNIAKELLTSYDIVGEVQFARSTLSAKAETVSTIPIRVIKKSEAGSANSGPCN
jgi:hypothetical protein